MAVEVAVAVAVEDALEVAVAEVVLEEDAVAEAVLEEEAVAVSVGQSISQRHSGCSAGVYPARSLFSQ